VILRSSKYILSKTKVAMSIDKTDIFFVWTGKVPTPEQVAAAQVYIQKEFGINFQFPEPSDADVEYFKRVSNLTELEGFPRCFNGGVHKVKKVMEFLDGLGIGSRVNVSEYTYDDYLKPPYNIYSRLGEEHTGIADAKAQIQKVLDLLPARDRKYILSTLGK
jgi:hypothetical protein